MPKYILEMAEPGRALVAISFNFIGFNTSGHMEFESREEVEIFLLKWKHHFYNFSYLKITPVKGKHTGG